MPQMPKPWFRKSRGVWYVQIHGKQHNLGSEQEAAFRRYHELMAKPKPSPETVSSSHVVGIIDAFLEWCHKHRSLTTYEWYRKYAQSFSDSISASMTVEQLKPFRVQSWVDSHSGWSAGTRRGAIMAVQRAFNWAMKLGYTDRNPIAVLEKPRGGRREAIIREPQYRQLLQLVKDEAFRDLITTAWETGCRPQELLAVEARHVELANARWVFPASEAKGKKRARVVYLTDTALSITRRLAQRYPNGKLFRNSEAEPWTPYSVNCRFCRIQIAIGRAVMREKNIDVDEAAVRRLAKMLVAKPEHAAKLPGDIAYDARTRLRARMARDHAPKLCLYIFRHSFATRLLEAGVDALTVATLLGHADVSMLSRVYQHLAQNPDNLLMRLRKASR